MKETNLKCRQGWGGSCRGGVGWELQGTESRNATGYQI